MPESPNSLTYQTTLYIILYIQILSFHSISGDKMNEYQIKAYAKINLALDVTGRRPDGYHLVRMVMQSIGLFDELTLRKAGSGITVTADTDKLPLNQDNLIYRAAELMIEKYGIRSGVQIHLRKKIPIAAGLAGGSTDAAAVMKGIARLFDLDAPPAQLMEYGLSIGADVPYCLMGGTALAEGIGEKLTALPPLPECLILVAKPDIMVSTKYVYEQLDRITECGHAAAGQVPVAHPDIGRMLAAISAGDLPGILPCMGNVLEAVTVPAHPVIDRLKDRMLQLGASAGLMSGSGPSVYGIFPMERRQAAQEALEIFRQEGLAEQVFLVTDRAGQ